MRHILAQILNLNLGCDFDVIWGSWRRWSWQCPGWDRLPWQALFLVTAVSAAPRLRCGSGGSLLIWLMLHTLERAFLTSRITRRVGPLTRLTEAAWNLSKSSMPMGRSQWRGPPCWYRRCMHWWARWGSAGQSYGTWTWWSWRRSEPAGLLSGGVGGLDGSDDCGSGLRRHRGGGRGYGLGQRRLLGQQQQLDRRPELQLGHHGRLCRYHGVGRRGTGSGRRGGRGPLALASCSLRYRFAFSRLASLTEAVQCSSCLLSPLAAFVIRYNQGKQNA